MKNYNLRAVLSYSSGEFGINAVETLLRVYLLIYYSTILGLDAFWTGLGLSVSTAIDAVSDPLVAYMSDRARMRGKSTKPFMIFGLIVSAVCLFGLLQPPSWIVANKDNLFWFLLLSSSLLSLGLTFYAIPYGSLPTAIIPMSHERTKFFAGRFGLGNLGAIFIVAGPGQMLSKSSPDLIPMLALIIVIAFVFTTGIALLPNYSAEKSQRPSFDQPNILKSFKELLTFRPLSYLLSVYFIATIGIAMNSTLALYFYRYRLFLTEGQIRAILVSFLLAITCSLPFWWSSTRKAEPLTTLRKTWLILTAITAVSYPLYQQGQFWPPLLIGAILLGFMVGSVILLDTLLGQLINLDEALNRRNRSAQIYSLWKFFAKSSRSVALFILGSFLSWLDFKTESATFANSLPIALAFGPGVAFFLSISAIGLWFFPLNQKKLMQADRILLGRKKIS